MMLQYGSLEGLKESLVADTDSAAQASRGLYRTAGVPYAEKLVEAERVLAGGPVGPLLRAEAAARKMDVATLAKAVVDRHALCSQLDARVEAERLRVKDAIRAATNVRAARLAFLSARWPAVA